MDLENMTIRLVIAEQAATLRLFGRWRELGATWKADRYSENLADGSGMVSRFVGASPTTPNKRQVDQFRFLKCRSFGDLD